MAVRRTAFSVGLGDDRVERLSGLEDPAGDGDFKEEDDDFEANGAGDFLISVWFELATDFVEAPRVSDTDGLGFAGVEAVVEGRCRRVAAVPLLARRSAIPAGVPTLFRLATEFALTATLEVEALVRLAWTPLSAGELPLSLIALVLEAVEGEDREPGGMGAALTVEPRNVADALAAVESFDTGLLVLLVRRLFAAAFDGFAVTFPPFWTAGLAVSASAVWSVGKSCFSLSSISAGSSLSERKQETFSPSIFATAS